MTCDPAWLGLKISLTVKSRRIFLANRHDGKIRVGGGGDGFGSGHFTPCVSNVKMFVAFTADGIIHPRHFCL